MRSDRCGLFDRSRGAFEHSLVVLEYEAWFDRYKSKFALYPTYSTIPGRDTAENLTVSIATARQNGWGCPRPRLRDAGAVHDARRAAPSGIPDRRSIQRIRYAGRGLRRADQRGYRTDEVAPRMGIQRHRRRAQRNLDLQKANALKRASENQLSINAKRSALI
jgi:hypothetical protein